ncbi:hypothetical protein GQ44DRAFT_733194 [Phaeosphaeriaceae sp. PMI808]|nr:hypothetical protein GQ44DRAFT_733194 [Phaeosphaeriaceae sp. PMI808]
MPKNNVNSDIVLEGQNNWELWIFVVKRIAEAGDVWEYIDPNQPHRPLQKPEQPIRPIPTLNANGSITQPTQQSLMQYNQDCSIYFKELKEFRRLRDKLGQVEAHITKTIQQDLLYHIKDETNVYGQIKILQGLYSPTTVDQEFRVQKAYESAKSLHARRSNLEDWCSDFLTAYNRAKQLDLPEVHGFRAHKDLIRAIKQVDATYAASISLDVFKAEETWNSNRIVPIPNQAQLPTILADILRYYRTTHSRKTNINGGVFGATLNQEKSPYSKKRPRDNATPIKPCLCGDTHFWGQCPYIDTALRTRGFIEDPEKAKKIVQFETKDRRGILNKIREKNRCFKKRNSKDNDARTESDSIEIDAGDDPSQQSAYEAHAVFSSAFNNPTRIRSYR